MLLKLMQDDVFSSDVSEAKMMIVFIQGEKGRHTKRAYIEFQEFWFHFNQKKNIQDGMIMKWLKICINERLYEIIKKQQSSCIECYYFPCCYQLWLGGSSIHINKNNSRISKQANEWAFITQIEIKWNEKKQKTKQVESSMIPTIFFHNHAVFCKTKKTFTTCGIFFHYHHCNFLFTRLSSFIRLYCSPRIKSGFLLLSIIIIELQAWLENHTKIIYKRKDD